MNKTKKIILYSLAAIVVIAAILIFRGNRIVKGKLEDLIQNDLPETISCTYDDISVHLSTGSASISNPVIILKNEEDGIEHTFINAKKIAVQNISYWSLLRNKKIRIGIINIEKPVITHYQDRIIQKKDSIKKSPNIDKPIFIKRLLISDAELSVNNADTLKLGVGNLSIEINRIELNENTINRKIPIDYKDLDIQGKSIFAKTSTYEDLTVENLSISNKDFTLDNIHYYTKLSKEEILETAPDKKEHLDFSIDSFNISNYSYGFTDDDTFFLNSDEIALNTPKFDIYKFNIEKEEVTDIKQDSIPKDKKPPINLTVHSFKINDADIKFLERSEKGKDVLKVASSNLFVAVNDILLNESTAEEKIPVNYSDFAIQGGALFLDAGKYEDLTAKSFQATQDNITVKNLHFFTKYSRAELSRIIRTERDHFNLTIQSLSINDFDFGHREDNRFFTDIKKIAIDSVNLDIYRDKLVRDDLTFKPLYSRALRELDFDLTVDSIAITNGNIKYTEKVHSDNQGGYVNFKDLNAQIANISNTYKAPEKTIIKVKTLFMDHAPLTAEWSFDVQNKNDQFIFKGHLERMDVSRMNRFTEPNVRARVSGNIHQTYFTINGNNYNSATHVRMNYSDLKVDILKKDGEGSRKFLSSLANVVISAKSKSKAKKDPYKTGEGTAERDKTKSVFNQLWASLHSGLKKAVL